MDRKKTILVAVLVNAGLLVVLFIASLSTREEIGGEIAGAPLSTMNGPLFSSDADKALQQEGIPSPTVHVPVSLNETPKISEQVIPEITHRLPLPSLESVSAPVVADARVRVVASHVVQVTVKKGDTLDKIAKAHHTTADEIIKINQLPGSFLKVGQVLKLPDQKATATVLQPKAAAEKSGLQGPEYYIVKVGDNPWGIAMKHHMKLDELLKLNQLNEEKARKLKPGDRLRTR